MTVAADEIIFEDIHVEGYEKVVKCLDPHTGLKAIIAIHNTQLGPALGGTRIYPYQNFDEALFDVLRLAEGMTYKSALAETGLGGGKSVIIADPKTEKTPELLRAFGRAVNALGGQYICAEDVGCTTEDVQIIREETPYVVGLVHEKSSGDPAPFTAWGVFRGIQATLKTLFGSDSLHGKTVAIQGIGAVGMNLIEKLFWHGATIIAADLNSESVELARQKYGVKIVPPEEILFVECDILTPCALGGILNADSIPKLKCKGIVGAANNQLLDQKSDSLLLAERGIIYAPDFGVNSGGLINVTFELSKEGYNPILARDKVNRVYDLLLSIYSIAKQNRTSTVKAACSLAEHRLCYGIGKRQETEYCIHHSTV